MEKMYVLMNLPTGEYFRVGHDSGDAYTDDLGNAVLYDDIHHAKMECGDNEKIVPVYQDEDGCLSLEVSE